MSTRRIVALLAPLTLCAALVAAPGPVLAAPSPSSLTVGVGGAAPPSEAFHGGPITGSADESGTVAPVVCAQPSCESIPLTLKAPAGFPAKSITLTVTVNFTSASGGALLGVDGLDIWIFDSAGNVVGSATLGTPPAVATASKLDPGAYTVDISGESAAVNVTYTGTARASVGASIASVTQGPSALTFSPATVVSPTILGAEPQISMEHPVAAPKPGAGLDTRRGFVDWPVSSRTQIGTLWRTLNGGDSYRQLVDLSCAPRQVPNCLTGGGGDTINRVNNYDATVNFGDQESLAQEAFASSVDHGDTWPAQRQTPVTSPFTGVDRQWISTVDAPGVMAGPVSSFELEALFSYHIPIAGEIVAGVGTDGVVRPGIPVIPSVTQSGPSRIDMQPGSHGHGWFYQSYRDGTGFRLGAAPVSMYQSPAAYSIGTVTTDQPQVFPWIALDRQGNLYAVWVAPDGQLYYSFSRITDPANDPTATPTPGVPGTRWSPKLRVNPPRLGSTVFPEVVAGDAGRIAIAYMATADYTGISDNAPAGTNPARWNTYVSLSTDALDSNPVFQTGVVSHRIDHLGSVCTSGTTCAATMGDRSLDDMIDVTDDADGRLAVTFMDNANAFAPQESSLGSQGTPWVKVSRQATGASLLRGHGPYSFSYPTAFRSSAAGDATWPNTAAGTNLPALDILGSGVFADGSLVVGRIDLADAGAAAFTRDLARYGAVPSSDLPASRLQYVVRWESGGDMYYMTAEIGSNGTPTFYGGKFDSSNAVNNVSAAVAVAYRPQASFPVTGQLQGHTLLLRGRMSDFGVSLGSRLVSYQAFSLAGPSDQLLAGAQPTSQVFYVMRDVDASPPMDAVIQGPQQQPPVNVPGSGPQPVALVSTSTPSPNSAAPGATQSPVALASIALLGLATGAARRRRARGGAS